MAKIETPEHHHNVWTCYAHCGGCNPCDCLDLEREICNPYFGDCPEGGVMDRPSDDMTCLALFVTGGAGETATK